VLKNTYDVVVVNGAITFIVDAVDCTGDTALVIIQGDQTITFVALADKTYGDDDFTVSATSSAGLEVSFTASGACTITGTTVHITGSGSCTLTAHQDGNIYYNAAPDVSQSFNIIPAALNINADDKSKDYGAALPTLTVTYTGLVNGDSAPATPPIISTTATASSPVGTYPITASGADDPNYTITYTPGTLTVNKAGTTVALTSSANPSFFLQCVTFTSTVTAVAPGAGTPTGTVTFKDGTTTLGTATLDSAGKATYRTPCLRPLCLGDHSITAVYNGDTTFTTSTSPVMTQTVLSWCQWFLRLLALYESNN